MAENLELRHNEFSQRLCDMTGCSMEEAKKEVDTTIQRLFFWGAYADKYGGTVQVSSKRDCQHTQEITSHIILSFLAQLGYMYSVLKFHSFPTLPSRKLHSMVLQ